MMREDVKLDDAYILIYNISGETAYAFYNNRASEMNNALDSCKVCGGENEPFEYAVLEVPRKKMYQIASELMEPNALVAGKNRIYINAMGRGEYVYASGDLTGNTCTIKAYCQAYRMTDMVLAENTSMTAFDTINYILTNGKYGTFISGKLKYWYCAKDQVKLAFKKGQSLWYVIQVCAMYLGCRIFFTGSDAYLVDYRLVGDKQYSTDIGVDIVTNLVCTTEPEIGNDGLETGLRICDSVYDFDTIELYTDDSTRPEYGKTVGSVKLGNEGLTTVINQVTITCKNNVTITVSNDKAKKQYNDTIFDKSLRMTDLLEANMNAENVESFDHQGLVVASNIIDYRCESQQSMEFTFKEFTSIGGEMHWVPFFPPSSRVKGIRDQVDDVNVSNTSTLNNTIIKPQKLILSSYTRNFPEGTSTYKFGVISSVDLQSKLNEMTTVQQNS